MSDSKFRPDLTEYDSFVEILRDVLNETGAYHMSKTDVVKIAIERLLESYAPQVKIVKTRKLYIRLEI